ncbi:MAG: O-antigen ligase family protein [Endomicrobiia bacterium]|nr:O-antigen ligase family protein [Endomicrobiia bacterium]
MHALLVFGVIALAAVAGGAWNVPAQAAVSALAAVALGYGVFREKIFRTDSRVPTAVGTFFIFTAYICARVFWRSSVGSDSANQWRGFIEAVNWASYLAVYFAAESFTDRERDFFFAALLMLGAFLAALFFAQKIFGGGVSDATTWATLPKKNVFAAVMLSSAYSVFDFRKNRLTAAERGCFLACALAAIFAFSVSMAMGFLASAVVLLGRSLPDKKKIWIPAMTFLAVAALVGKFLEPRVWDRFAWYAASVRMFASSPAFGVGVGNFAQRAAQFSSSKFMSVYAHSLYLETLSETGVVGLALLVVLFYFILRRISDVRARAIFVLVAVASATDFVFNIPLVPLILFAAAGAGAAIKPDDFKPPPPVVSVVFTRRLAAPMAAILAMFLMAASFVKYDVWTRLRRAEVLALDGNYEAAVAAADGIGYGRLGEAARASLKIGIKK